MKRLTAYIEKKFLRAVDEDVRLSALWGGLAPAPLVRHFRPVAYAQGQLTLHTESNAWASRLRQQQEALREQLRRDPYFQDLATVVVRVTPTGSRDVGVVPTQGGKPRSFTASTAALLRQVAASENDSPLGAALSRLAATAAKQVKKKDPR